MTAVVAYRQQGRPKYPRLQKVAPAEDPRFEQRAMCSPDTAALFDEKGAREPTGHYRQRRNQARAVCRDCPVQTMCLSFGKANKLSGFMGGVDLIEGRPLPTGNPGRR